MTTVLARSAVALIAATLTWAAHAQRGDVFATQGRSPPGDVFSSSGNPYGGPHPSRRTGKQAIQDDSVYCQQDPQGRVIPKPYGGTRRNIPCGLPGGPGSPGGPRAAMPAPAPSPPAPARPAPATPPRPEACECPPSGEAAAAAAPPVAPDAAASSASAPAAPRAAQGGPARRMEITDMASRDGTAGRRTASGRCTCPVVPVFNYYYFNGINTPVEGLPGTRGNCRWDRAMIAANLLDLRGSARMPAPTQKGAGFRTPVKIAGTRDVFDLESCNPSGTQMGADLVNFCASIRKQKPSWTDPGLQFWRFWCDTATLTPDVLGHGITGVPGAGNSPGDLLESFRQSQEPHNGLPLAGINYSANSGEVKKVADAMIRAFRDEQAQKDPRRRTRQYFVVIAHSQGNFFAEGLAYRMMMTLDGGDEGRAIYQTRMAVLSLASPNNYPSLDAQFRSSRIRHLTRQDDVILMLNDVGADFARRLNVEPRKPWPPDPRGDVPPLWPWPPADLPAYLKANRAQTLMTFGPPKNPPCNLKNFGDVNEQARCDGALYVPLVNAHLLDNYLTDPTLTTPGVPVNPLTAHLLYRDTQADAVAPRTTPVLRQVRAALRELKQGLIDGH